MKYISLTPPNYSVTTKLLKCFGLAGLVNIRQEIDTPLPLLLRYIFFMIIILSSLLFIIF
ncbi:hypothetical protein HanPSC8_Chr11g0489511 [Helianthus annuus]|nr:hypothetical protein HanPSC8_Chr11g0489511 [Helianthus annuus]